MVEISIAIRGFGKLASPIQQFMGTAELKKLLQKLFQVWENFYR